MPTSATGNNSPPQDAGFSLVETMTAMMVVALVASSVLLLAPGQDRRTRDEAMRLVARIGMAQDESVLVNRTVALVLTADGYGFERLEAGGWAPFEPNTPLGFRAWPEDVEARAERDENESRAARFDAMGTATPTSIIVSGAGVRWRVRVDASGETNVAPVE